MFHRKISFVQNGPDHYTIAAVHEGDAPYATTIQIQHRMSAPHRAAWEAALSPHLTSEHPSEAHHAESLVNLLAHAGAAVKAMVK